MSYELQRPGEKQDYTCDWSVFLAATGSPADTISSVIWTITPQEGSPLQPILSDQIETTVLSTIWVDDCVRGEIYRLIGVVTTAAGREQSRTIVIRCGP